MTAAPLTKLTASLFELPPFAQRAENICSMVNFFPLAERLMNRLENISKIVEIGAENGYNTSALLDYAVRRHILLDTVDPSLPENAKQLLQSPQFRFHQTVSGEYLAGNDRYHVIFMDGDHNYETVLTDLETIDRKRKQNCIKVIFLHDVCWPWAYRDIYYGPERIKAPHPYDYNIRVSPYEEERSEQGLSSGNYATALAEGGENNGVLCAVENFLKTAGPRWRFKSFPVLYGIGVLYDVENFSQKELNAFETELHQQLSSRELMSVLELNRVENLCRIEALRLDIVRAGEVWKQDQSYIATLEANLKERDKTLEANRKEYQQIQCRLIEQEAKLEEQKRDLEKSTEERQLNQSYVTELQAKLEKQKLDLEKSAEERLQKQSYIAELQTKLEKQKLDLEKSAEERLQKQSYIAELQTKLEKQKLDMEKSAEEWQRNQSYVVELQAKLEEQKLDLEKSAEERQQTQSYITELQTNLDGCKQQLVDTTGKNTVLQQDLDRLSKLNCSLREQNQALEQEKDRWQSNCNKLKKNRLELEEFIRHGEHRCQELLNELTHTAARGRELEGELWNSRQKIRSLLIRTPDIFWRWHGGKWNCLLPYGVRNRCRLHKIAELLHTSEIHVFSIDVFDTLLLREYKSEIARFREIAELVHQAFPEISSRKFFQARALAHRLAYQLTRPVQGCREAAFDSIYRLIGAILQEHDATRLAAMQEIELSYETSHLRLNPNIRKLLEIARMRNLLIVAVSDMYLNRDALARIINNFLPPGMINEIYSSADFGISKISGLLWDEVLRREQVSPQAILHLGDNPVADFEMPYIRCGITSVLMLRSALYNRYIRGRNRRDIKQLQKERIYNGVR